MRYNEDDIEWLEAREQQEREDAELRAIASRTRAKMVAAQRRGYKTDLQLERDTGEVLDVLEEIAGR